MSDHATTAPSPAPLAELLLALRAVMSEERRAVSRLDLALLESSTARKRTLCAELATWLEGPGRSIDRDAARLIARMRVELGANAALVTAAREAVAAALGLQRDDRYGRSARNAPYQPATGTVRVVAY